MNLFSSGSESEPLSKSKRKGRKPTKFTSLKKFVKKKENKQTKKDSASVSALVNGENTSSKKRTDQKSNEESSSTTSGEVEVTANEETSQVKNGGFFSKIEIFLELLKSNMSSLAFLMIQKQQQDALIKEI